VIIISPTQITAEKLISSNVALSDYPAWDADRTYQVGERVHHRPGAAALVYDFEAVNQSTAVEPGLDGAQSWVRVGASKRFSAFDAVLGAGASQPNTVEFVVRPGGVINAVGLFGVRGITARVQVFDEVDGVFYDNTYTLQNSGLVTNWYSYFFEPFRPTEEVVMLDLPLIRNAFIRVTIDAGAGEAQIGEAVFGQQKLIGVTNFGTSVSINDYSRKERDEFGQVSVVSRRFAKTASYDVTVQTNTINEVQQVLASVRATPTVYIGSLQRPETVVYGFYKAFNIVISSPTVSSCSIEVEGLT
jgi:hypothetical protein